MNQSGRHNQLQRQPGQDRQARTSGARTKPKGPDKARTRTPGIKRVKPRVRPAMPQTSGARAARISASGCKAVKAGSSKPLKLRIGPLHPRRYDMPCHGCFGFVHGVSPRRDCPALFRAKKKPAWPNTQRYSITPAYSLTGPLGMGPGCPLASHPTTPTTRFEHSIMP